VPVRGQRRWEVTSQGLPLKEEGGNIRTIQKVWLKKKGGGVEGKAGKRKRLTKRKRVHLFLNEEKNPGHLIAGKRTDLKRKKKDHLLSGGEKSKKVRVA